VHLKERAGETLILQLVMPEEADAEGGLISPSSPIGRALLNREPGDEVVVRTPSGERHFEIARLITIFDEV